MHPAYVMQVSRHHPRAVGREDVAQFWDWQFPPVLGNQASDAESTTAVATVAENFEDREAAGALAESNETGGVDAVSSRRSHNPPGWA
jgi:hypothetical protein